MVEAVLSVVAALSVATLSAAAFLAAATLSVVSLLCGRACTTIPDSRRILLIF